MTELVLCTHDWMDNMPSQKAPAKRHQSKQPKAPPSIEEVMLHIQKSKQHIPRTAQCASILYIYIYTHICNTYSYYVVGAVTKEQRYKELAIHSNIAAYACLYNITIVQFSILSYDR